MGRYHNADARLCNASMRVGQFWSLIINFVLRVAPRGRPINAIILLDQAVQLCLSLIFTSMTIISLATATPLSQFFGNEGCSVLWLAITVHNLSISGGNLTMALFRVGFVVTRESPIRRRIRTGDTLPIAWLVELTLVIFIFVPNFLGKQMSGSSPVMQFCRGHSGSMEVAIMKYEGVSDESLKFGMLMLSLSYLMGQGYALAELTCYVYLFWYLRKKNQSISHAISAEEQRRRRQGNAMNMVGQAICYAIHLSFTMLMTILLNIDKENFLPPASFACLLIATLVFTNVAYIFASPELRRTYL